MPLLATLPLAIGLKFFWFLIALLLYPKSTILGLSFLNPKDLCLPNQFSKTFYQYILNLMSKKKLGSFNDWINAYFQSFICLPRYEHFLASIFCKVCLALLNRIQPILERLKENIIKPWKPSIIDRSKWCWHWFSFKFKRLVILNVHHVKSQSIHGQKGAALVTFVNSILHYLHTI